jgi:cytosine deaminase
MHAWVHYQELKTLRPDKHKLHSGDSAAETGRGSVHPQLNEIAPARRRRAPSAATGYFSELANRITGLGGLHNAHLHLDRAGTYHRTVQLLAEQGVGNGSSLPIAGKHAVIPLVHASELFDPPVLRARTAGYLESMLDVGTAVADTVVDVTADRVGLTALETFLDLKADFSDRFLFRPGAYTPLGFRDDQPRRWDLFREGALLADLIGLLPERDDKARYPDHIGFAESCRRGIGLALELGKPIHIHVDQGNVAREQDSEIVARVVRELTGGRRHGPEPLVWLIHVISPSTYEEGRFQRLLDEMADMDIGVITCPSAAISMRQYRPLPSPTYNSIARVLDMLAAGIQVRVGSDNICDITSPAGTVDLLDEMFVLCNAMRYYDIDVMARMASGQRLSTDERERVARHLREEHAFVAEFVGAPGTERL